MAGALLYFAHAVFIPIALAVLFALLLSGPVEALHRKGLPRSLSALLALLIFLTLIGTAVLLLWAPAQGWLAAAPRTAQTIQRKIGPAARIVQRIDALTARAGHMTEPAGSATTQAAQAPPASDSAGVLSVTSTALIATVSVIILTLFLLAAGPPVLSRMSAAFASSTHAGRIMRLIQAVRSEVGRYYVTIALINLGLAVATCLAMMALRMPNPVLWGVLAGVLNFIPYVGSATTFLTVTAVAFVSFHGIGHILAVSGSYLALATLEGQVVQPLFVGQRLELNPIIVFLSLWLAGWFWGVAGIILAIPSLVTLKVVAEHSPGGKPLVEFLSPSQIKRVKPPPKRPSGDGTTRGATPPSTR
jgi:predicted PurR-regulated permease PerM